MSQAAPTPVADDKGVYVFFEDGVAVVEGALLLRSGKKLICLSER